MSVLENKEDVDAEAGLTVEVARLRRALEGVKDWALRSEASGLAQWCSEALSPTGALTVFSPDVAYAVELAAARGGTMTAEQVAALFAMPWCANSIGSDVVQQHISALGARNTVLEAERDAARAALEKATICVGELEAEKETLRAEIRQARLCIQELRGGTRETVYHLEQQRDTLRSELVEARATIARLIAAGQALSEIADRHVGAELTVAEAAANGAEIRRRVIATETAPCTCHMLQRDT